jgi:hypothetical protein
MLTDALIALLIVVIAAVLGLVVHPVLWFIAAFAVVWLFFHHGSHRGTRSGTYV